MELTPSSIVEFFKEAQILHDLRNDYVVECKGITIVPPAIGVVMEHCAHGSLFEFLYEHNRHVQRRGTLKSFFTTTGISSVSRNNSKTSCSTKSEVTEEQDHARMLEMGHRASTSSERDSVASVGATGSPEEQSRSGHSFDWIFKSRKTKPVGNNEILNRSAVLHRPSREEFSDMQNYEMMLDAAKGLAYIHSKGYMHCDVKSLNFLVTEVFSERFVQSIGISNFHF